VNNYQIAGLVLATMIVSDVVFKTRLMLAVLVFIDCLLNMAARGSFNETLSARAHRLREEKHSAWGWTADVIDKGFFWQKEHCKSQFLRERTAGSAWKALGLH
jgi:hypothetical protein